MQKIGQLKSWTGCPSSGVVQIGMSGNFAILNFQHLGRVGSMSDLENGLFQPANIATTPRIAKSVRACTANTIMKTGGRNRD